MSDDTDIQALQGVFQRQVQQLTRLTGDLLDISRITRDKLALQRQRVAVSQVIDNAVETVRPLFARRNQEIEIDVPSRGLFVDGDPARLAQVLANLLDNAARYSSEGARIALTVSVSGPHVLIKVSDPGSGIERELLSKIFELFVQGTKAPHGGEGGLGVGLPLARRLSEMHGGSLTAYSAGPGRGSEFTLQLPLLPVSEPDKADAVSSEPRQLPPQRVLIIEDNRDTAAMMDLMLTEWGQETRMAHDGPTALAIANEFKPQVVLLDVGLPKLHGYEVARRLRQQEWARDTFVIAITGWGLEADRQGDAAGIDHRLLKPVDPDTLHALLAKTLRA